MTTSGVRRYPSTQPQRSMPPEPDRAPVCAAAPDPDLWFPERGGARAAIREEAAKAGCRRCHFRPACLEYALVTRQEHGIWGAKNPNQRARILQVLHAQRQLDANGAR